MNPEKTIANQLVLQYTLNRALEKIDKPIIKQCLIAGVSLENISIKWITNMQFSSPSILKMLLDHDTKTLFDNTKFMVACINTVSYLEILISAGYNADCQNTLQILKSLETANSLSVRNLNLLLDNGFDKYANQLAMACIRYDQLDSLKNLIKRGMHCYLILDDFCLWIGKYRNSYTYNVDVDVDVVKIFLDNIYKIKSMKPVIDKYLVLRASMVGSDVGMFVMQLYMELDFVRTRRIRDLFKL